MWYFWIFKIRTKIMLMTSISSILEDYRKKSSQIWNHSKRYRYMKNHKKNVNNYFFFKLKQLFGLIELFTVMLSIFVCPLSYIVLRPSLYCRNMLFLVITIKNVLICLLCFLLLYEHGDFFFHIHLSITLISLLCIVMYCCYP